ncbi:MAG: NfeD family protein, partial [Rhodothermales bacterium]|nr:NfeD family protein [Rhodothermales bacterium]
ANGRDPRIAEAMVDQSIEVEGVSEAGKVLTLSTSEAVNLKVADFASESLADIYETIGVEVAAVVNHRATRAEQVLRFFASPIMQSILMLMMLGGLYFELQTPGVGFAGLMAALGAAAFFAPHYMLGLVESWEIVVFALGVGLIIVEIFVIPGFGIAGVAGVILVFGSLLAALVGNIGFDFPTGESISSAITTLAVTLVLFVILLFSLSRYLPRSERFGQLVLQPELASSAGYTAAETRDDLVGLEGTTITPLRPTGTVEINGDRFDATSVSDYVAAGVRVVVRSVRGGRIEVRAVPENSET